MFKLGVDKLEKDYTQILELAILSYQRNITKVEFENDHDSIDNFINTMLKQPLEVVTCSPN